MTRGPEMQRASATEHKRYMRPIKTPRSCCCGCKQRAAYIGVANGIALTVPLCALAVRRWVRYGFVSAPPRT